MARGRARRYYPRDGESAGCSLFGSYFSREETMRARFLVIGSAAGFLALAPLGASAQSTSDRGGAGSGASGQIGRGSITSDKDMTVFRGAASSAGNAVEIS